MDGEATGPGLMILDGPNLSAMVRLEEHALVIGSGASSALVLEAPGVSTRHARVEPRGRRWVLVDLAGRDSTRVNSSVVEEHPLCSRDRIHLGEVPLFFSNHREELKAWLRGPAPFLETDQKLSRGFLRGQWRTMKDAMRPGDELFHFGSPADSWQRLGGRVGVCIVRDDVVVYTLATLMN